MRKAFLLLTAALSLAAANAQQGSLDQAWKLVGQGRSDQALALLQRIVQEEPRNPKARLLLGSLLTERKQPEAIAQLTEAVRLLPKSAEAANALAEGYLALGDSKSARPALEKAIALDPGYGIAHLNLGRLLLESGDLPAAAQHLETASKFLNQSDEAAEAQYLLAKCASARDDSTAAALHLHRAVQLNPQLAAAWSDLGATQQLLQQDDDAVKSYRRAVALNSSDPVAEYRLGSQLIHLGKAHEAVEHLQAAYRLDPQDQSTLNALQSALRRDGRSPEADKVRQTLADLLHSRDEKNQNALAAVKLNNQGAAFEKSGDLRSAMEKYQAALALDPEHNGIRVNYAVALLRQGQWSEGLTQLREAARRDPANSQLQTALKDALAQAPRGAIPAWNDAKPAQ